MASRIKARITDTATKLFADCGFHGVSTRDVAKAARVTEGSIYRIFASKDGLFKETIAAALGKALDPAHFLLMIYENQHNQDATSILTSAVLRWYSSLTQSSARLLLQAYLLAEWREFAYGPIEKIMKILASHLDGAEKSKDAAKVATTAARASILSILQFKVTYASSCTSKQETEAITALIHQWFKGFASAK